MHVVKCVVEALAWTEILHQDDLAETLGGRHYVVELERCLYDIETRTRDGDVVGLVVRIR